MGLLTPLGNELEEFWGNITSSRSGIKRIGNEEDEEKWIKIGGKDMTKLPKNFRNFGALNFSEEEEALLSLPEVKELGMFSGTAFIAAKKALLRANLRPDYSSIGEKNNNENNEKIQTTDEEEGGVSYSRIEFPSDNFVMPSSRTGVIMGSGIGNIQTISNTDRILNSSGYRRISPYFIPKILINLASGLVSKLFCCKGPIGSSVLACATGSDVISQGFKIIRDGEADIMIVGSSEDSLNPLTICGFARMKAIANHPNAEEASRPFDKHRNGFVISEGAGVLVLEELEFARKRNAPIYAEVRGIGSASDAYHWSRPSPDGSGAINAMIQAIKNSGLQANSIDYLNAHATSTPAGDYIENMAVKEVFADHSQNLAISSIKSSIGHLLGASGSVEAIASILALNTGIMPPTINLTSLEDEFSLNYVPNTPQERNLHVVMSNSFGFGGVNSSIIFSEPPPL